LPNQSAQVVAHRRHLTGNRVPRHVDLGPGTKCGRCCQQYLENHDTRAIPTFPLTSPKAEGHGRRERRRGRSGRDSALATGHDWREETKNGTVLGRREEEEKYRCVRKPDRLVPNVRVSWDRQSHQSTSRYFLYQRRLALLLAFDGTKR
jgi:hypothetical protein